MADFSIPSTFQGMVVSGVFEALVSTVKDPSNQRAILQAIGFPRKSFPSTGTSQHFWIEVCAQIDAGSIPGGFEDLLREVGSIYPWHPVFGRYTPPTALRPRRSSSVTGMLSTSRRFARVSRDKSALRDVLSTGAPAETALVDFSYRPLSHIGFPSIEQASARFPADSEAAVSQKLSSQQPALTRTSPSLPSNPDALSRPEMTRTAGYAVAHIGGDYVEGQPLYTDQLYRLYTGIQPARFPGGASEDVELPDEDLAEIDISVAADGVEILPHWMQRLCLPRSHPFGLVAFHLRPTVSGTQRLRIDFTHDRQWLQTLALEVEIKESVLTSVHVQDPYHDAAYEKHVPTGWTARELIASLSTEHEGALASEMGKVRYRLLFRGMLLPDSQPLAGVGLSDGAELMLVVEQVSRGMG